MNDKETHKKLNQMTLLLAANLFVMTIFAGAIIFGLLPKINHAVETSDRVEARFHTFADTVEPVLSSGAGKAIETINAMDTEGLTDKLEEKTDDLIGKATDRVERILDRDKSGKD